MGRGSIQVGYSILAETCFPIWLVALIPVVLLLFLLAGQRMSALFAVLTGSIVTFLLGFWVWKMPFGDGVLAYVYGSATDAIRVAAIANNAPVSYGARGCADHRACDRDRRHARHE